MAYSRKKMREETEGKDMQQKSPSWRCFSLIDSVLNPDATSGTNFYCLNVSSTTNFTKWFVSLVLSKYAQRWNSLWEITDMCVGYLLPISLVCLPKVVHWLQPLWIYVYKWFIIQEVFRNMKYVCLKALSLICSLLSASDANKSSFRL